jgi:hypothetical protein
VGGLDEPPEVGLERARDVEARLPERAPPLAARGVAETGAEPAERHLLAAGADHRARLGCEVRLLGVTAGPLLGGGGRERQQPADPPRLVTARRGVEGPANPADGCGVADLGVPGEDRLELRLLAEAGERLVIGERALGEEPLRPPAELVEARAARVAAADGGGRVGRRAISGCNSGLPS